MARGAAAVAPNSDSKLLRTLRARRGIRARYRAWGDAHRDATKQLLWMHAPSVGEGLQARPVLEIARSRRPELQLAYTHFSPSAASFAASLNVDFHDYLPFDTTGDAHAALDALKPTALVFSKLDVWPVITREARARGVRLGLISATMSRGSSRRSRTASTLLRDAYAVLEVVGAIDEVDADRLVQLGVRSSVVVVTGDTRYDQVWQRAGKVDSNSALLSPLRSDRPTIVAGSTWPADEAVVLPALELLRNSDVDARMIIAPHEPTPDHVTSIVAWAKDHNVRVALLGTDEANQADIIVVDRVGVLGDLYALADVAFVGGGFHSAGLHSVLEPAAFGAPVAFGPMNEMSRDATLLAQRGGGVAVATDAELCRRFKTWLTNPAGRKEASDYARALVRSGVGAAERSYGLIARLLQ
ncbi:MAG: glycosyltransferase N-terminal domain-containing protein [Gemmatimonadaceae bacterium]